MGICGDVAVKGLDYGQGGHAAAAALVAEVSGALEKTGVQIENIAGVGFTAGGALEQKAQGTVGDGVLAQIVIDDEDVAALFP